MDIDEMREQFAEMLNGNYGTIELGGVEYDYATVWERTSPHDYRLALSEWADAVEAEAEEAAQAETERDRFIFHMIDQ